MAKGTTIILLKLEGVLQSWGDHSKWDYRDSADFPSKSGVAGLLACAMGMERGDPAMAELASSLRIAVRADRPGVRMVDFHTVKGEPRLMTANGTPRGEDKSTIVSRRWYLQDASFLAAVDAGALWTPRICQGLRDPKWPVFLGRKSCVPSRPVLERVTEEYTSVLDAIFRYPAVSENGERRSPAGLRYECEEELGDSSLYTRADQLLSGERDFALRTVYSGIVPEEETPCT